MTTLGEGTEDLWVAPTLTEPLQAVVSLPGSKSLTNRALILGALATTPSTITGALRSRDTLLMAAALQALGATVDTSGADWAITPAAFDTMPAADIDCGLAGTVMRFVPPVAGLARGPVRFDGDPHMRTRPIGPMLVALRSLGLEIDDDHRGSLPFAVHGSGAVPGGQVEIDASGSSQFISALLLSGARFEHGVDILHVGKPVPSLPHIEMSISMLREHGVEVDDSEPDRWRVAPGPITARDRVIEPDLSNAAPFLAAAALSAGTVTIRHWPTATTQPGDELRDLLTRMGCAVRLDQDGLHVQGPDELHGIDVDLHDLGELTPALAALCTLAVSPSHLRGIAHIRGHETDRLAALTRELNNLGADVTEHADGLSIKPAPLHGGVFHTYADHRMAHAAVILGAAVPGIEVENVATTAKTFPDFDQAWTSFLRGRGQD